MREAIIHKVISIKFLLENLVLVISIPYNLNDDGKEFPEILILFCNGKFPKVNNPKLEAVLLEIIISYSLPHIC